MACSVKYLSSAGIQYREVKGVEALAKECPADWLLYASLNAFPKNSSPIEIDLFVVMDDRVVLLELKDWNGAITLKGDLWVHAGKRVRSPVVLGNEKAKKIKGILKDQIPSLSKVYVDSRVVLTGTSTRDLLSASEKPFVLTLEEAKRLGDKKERNRLLGQVTLPAVKPNMLVKDFEKLFGNGSYFQPKKMTWDGYAVTDEDFYVHRGDIWREHRVQLAREERVKGLLRLWRFDKLPVGLNEPGGRRLIADRELRAVAYLGDNASWMSERGILKQIGASPDEVLTEHHQVLSVPAGWTTLRRYLARNGAELSGEHRVDIAHTIASMIAELHSHDLAHRDIGGDAIWVGSPTNMVLTGFFSATIPDQISVADYLGVLGTYSEPEQDWGGAIPTGKERDVRSVGLLMRELAALEIERASLPTDWMKIVDRALSAPGQRFADGRGLAEALGELKTPSGPQIDQSRLDELETTVIPYVAFPPTGQPISGAHSTRYESVDGQRRTLVKVWNGLLRGDAHRDHVLLTMLEEAISLRAVPLNGVAPVVASGLSPVGPFLVTEWVDGTPLKEYVAPNEKTLLIVLADLVSSVEALHSRGFGHGDLHPDNVIVGSDNKTCLIDALDICPVGPGRLGSPAWAPDDRERCSTQQVDRFAVCKIVMILSNAWGTPSSLHLAAMAQGEMERRPIETLNPIAQAIADALYELSKEPAPTFQIASPIAAEISLETDDGKLWVRRHCPSDHLEVFWITGLNRRLLVRIRDGNIEAVDVANAALVELGRGKSIAMSVSIQPGDHQGDIAALVAFLQGRVDPEIFTTADGQQEAPDWEGEDEVSELEVAAELLEEELVPTDNAGTLDVR